MKAHHWVSIIIKIFSIFVGIYALRQTSLIFNFFLNEGTDFGGLMLLIAISPMIFFIFIALILWFFPITFSRILVCEEADNEVGHISKLDLLLVIIISLGIYLTYQSISDLTYWITNFLFIKSEESYGISSGLFDADSKASMFSTVVECAASLLLVFKARAIARFVLKSTG